MHEDDSFPVFPLRNTSKKSKRLSHLLTVQEPLGYYDDACSVQELAQLRQMASY
jgi:hypothetical protein